MAEDQKDASNSEIRDDPPSQGSRTVSLCDGRCVEAAAAAWGGRVESSWRPGVVHVEFREPYLPELLNEKTPLAPRAGAWAADINVLKQIFKDFGQPKCELTFRDDLPEQRLIHDRERFTTFVFDDDADVCRIAKAFQRLSQAIYAAPEPRLAPASTPLNEPLVRDGGAPLGKVVAARDGVQNQWYLFRCRADAAWKLRTPAYSGKNVIVADIDWGFLPTHQDLSEPIKKRYNAKTGDTKVDVGNLKYHGTAVLGMIGAADNELGMAGFAYGAELWAIQAQDDATQEINSEWWRKAIDYVCREPSQDRRKVILIEAQTYPREGNVEMSAPINKAIRDAIQTHKAIVCVAAGNGGHPVDINDCGEPIPQTGSILIGATAYDSNPEPKRIKRSATNWGEWVVVSAPGDIDNDVSCCSCGNGKYRNEFGATSGAAAKVAGTIALMLEANHDLTQNDVREILRTCGPPISDDISKPIGCFLDTGKAVQEAAMRARQRGRPHLFRTLKRIIRLFSVSPHSPHN